MRINVVHYPWLALDLEGLVLNDLLVIGVHPGHRAHGDRDDVHGTVVLFSRVV